MNRLRSEARVLIEDWRLDDDQRRPHSTLGMNRSSQRGVVGDSKGGKRDDWACLVARLSSWRLARRAGRNGDSRARPVWTPPGMMTPAAFAAGLRQRRRPPTAAAAGEGANSAPRFLNAPGATQPSVLPAPQRPSPAEEITPTSPTTNRDGNYRGTIITPTQPSQQVGPNCRASCSPDGRESRAARCPAPRSSTWRSPFSEGRRASCSGSERRCFAFRARVPCRVRTPGG